MKKITIISAAILTAFISCGTDDPAPEQEAVPLSVDKTSLEFTAAASEQTFTVTASETLYLVPGDNWLTVTKAGTSGNQTTVSVKVTENTAYESRESRISVVAGEERLYVAVTQAAATSPLEEDYPENDGSLPWQVLAKLGMGWNLGNQMEAHNNGVASETAWGNQPATQATFNAVKAAGYKTVRIPVTWMGHFGAAPDYVIEEAWLNRVAEIVGYAETAGLNAIINIHHDGADSKYWLDIKTAAINSAVNEQIKAQITALWTQIANKFKDKGDFLIFEAFNEIHDGDWGWGDNLTDGGKQYATLNGWNQTFVKAVRATGGNNATRFLAVPGYCTNPALTVEHFVMPTDSAPDKLIVAVHYYDPYDYTLNAKYSEWGHTAAADKCAGTKEEEAVVLTFTSLYNTFIANGIPVYIGEMGCVNRATAREQAFQRYWFEYVVKAAKTFAMSPIVWDNGAEGSGYESSAFINHATGAYCSEPARLAVETMTSAMNNDDADYTLDTVYANAPK